MTGDSEVSGARVARFEPVFARPSRGGVVGALGAIVVLAYPVVIYFALTSWGTRPVGLLLLLLVFPSLVVSTRRLDRRARETLLQAPAAVAALALLAFVINDRRFLMALPTLVNGALLASFGASLRGDRTIVEQYARLDVEHWNSGKVRYCRSVTIAWCVFFALNGLIAALLAMSASFRWWALFTGVISYVLIGMMFTVEYVVRRIRFANSAAGQPSPSYGVGAGHRAPAIVGVERHEKRADKRGEVHVFEVHVPEDLLYFRGHFPGFPILPGIVQLHEIVLPLVYEIRSDLPGLRRINRLKFRHPIRPDDRLELRLAFRDEQSAVEFEIKRDDKIYASGRLVFGPA